MEEQTTQNYNQQAPYKSEKKLVAGILGILLGGFGIHKFYLGYTKAGIIQIIITLVTCGIASVIGLVEGIIYLTKSDEEFDRTYVQGQKNGSNKESPRNKNSLRISSGYFVFRMSSIICNSSAEKFRLSVLSRFCCNWATELAPISTDVTRLSFSNHAIAIWANV